MRHVILLVGILAVIAYAKKARPANAPPPAARRPAPAPAILPGVAPSFMRALSDVIDASPAPQLVLPLREIPVDPETLKAMCREVLGRIKGPFEVALIGVDGFAANTDAVDTTAYTIVFNAYERMSNVSIKLHLEIIGGSVRELRPYSGREDNALSNDPLAYSSLAGYEYPVSGKI